MRIELNGTFISHLSLELSPQVPFRYGAFSAFRFLNAKKPLKCVEYIE